MSNIVTSAFQDIPDDWLSLIINKNKSDIDNIVDNIDIEKTTPPPAKWFEWARLTQLDSIRIIIIGQDPYPTEGNAHGLAFSSLNEFPGSLQNIFKCLEHHKLIQNYRETKTDLTSWAKQGILLFNTALTTEIKNPGAHIDLWSNYSKRMLKRILHYHLESNLFILCWGKVAQNFIGKIIKTRLEKFTILEWCHPSPLTHGKFISCDHFIRINEHYEANGMPAINWQSIESVPTQIIFTDGSCRSIKNRKSKDVGGETDQKVTDKVATKVATGGYAVFFAEGTIQSKVLIGSLESPTNIRAECKGIIKALETMADVKEKHRVTIYTDSEFWIKMIYKYMPAWIASGKSFEDKANPDMTKALWRLWNDCHHNVKLEHVYSHNKSNLRESKNLIDQKKYRGNELADKYATEGRQLILGESKWIDIAEQW